MNGNDPWRCWRNRQGSFSLGGESPRTNCNRCAVNVMIVRRVGLLWQLVFVARESGAIWQKRRRLPAETPQHYHHTTLPGSCQLWCGKSFEFSVLYQILGSYLCRFPSCKLPGDMVDWWYEKGDTRYGNDTCRLGFPLLPFYINANRNDKLKNMNAAEGIPTKQEKPGRSSRKRGYPMIEPKEKKWPPAEVGGHFLCAAGNGLGALPANKNRPEKSDPTQLSYHMQLFKSTAKRSRICKICIPHKSRCAHLGNIPSWKVGKIMLSYSHKEEIPKQ